MERLALALLEMAKWFSERPPRFLCYVMRHRPHFTSCSWQPTLTRGSMHTNIRLCAHKIFPVLPLDKQGACMSTS